LKTDPVLSSKDLSEINCKKEKEKSRPNTSRAKKKKEKKEW